MRVGTAGAAFLAAVCAQQQTHPSPSAVTLKPAVVTERVNYDPDDPAIWVDAQDSNRRLVIGTDKNADGELVVARNAGSKWP